MAQFQKAVEKMVTKQQLANAGELPLHERYTWLCNQIVAAALQVPTFKPKGTEPSARGPPAFGNPLSHLAATLVTAIRTSKHTWVDLDLTSKQKELLMTTLDLTEHETICPDRSQVKSWISRCRKALAKQQRTITVEHIKKAPKEKNALFHPHKGQRQRLGKYIQRVLPFSDKKTSESGHTASQKQSKRREGPII